MPAVVSVALLATVLVAATVRPRGLPEAVVAVPAAIVAVAADLLAPDAALAEVQELAPTVALVVLGATLAGFAASSLAGVEPVWSGRRRGRGARGARAAPPHDHLVPESTSLGGLLAVAGVAALLANLGNNLPATLVLLQVLGDRPAPALVLAMLLGVIIGLNLT